jgi:hypothetical protein
MKTFRIYLQKDPLGSILYDKSLPKEENYEMVGEVEDCTNQFAVFHKTQNWDTPWNKKQPCRSTMVGDIFEDVSTNTFYLVEGIGLKQLDISLSS